MARRFVKSRLKAPFLRRVWMARDRMDSADRYPFNLPIYRDGDFEMSFSKPITIIVGENGSGKSTLLEAIAGLVGFDQAGGGPGYKAVDHAMAREANADILAAGLRGSWLPLVRQGWFFRAESFFSVARYLDAVGSPCANFLSHSHGEGFLRFFNERCRRRGVFILDEPEAALSPSRQIEFLKILRDIERSGEGQIIMATHAPMLMAYPGAELLEISGRSLKPVALENLSHFRMLRAFFNAPDDFLRDALEE